MTQADAFAGVDSIEQLTRVLDEQGIKRHKMAATDVDGVLRGKYVEREKFLAAARSGFGFCDVVLGWDSGDQLLDNLTVSGWHTGYRDAPVTLDLSTLRRIPFEPDTALLLGSFTGDYAAVCPRTTLARVVERARAMGFDPLASLEYEFFVFDETPESVREKGYRNLKPLTPGMFGYSMLRSGLHADFYHEILDVMAEARCPVEGLHTETGPGVIEAALRYGPALEAADRAALFKTFLKTIAQRRGWMATFMAKWSSAYPGQSGHIHVSLTDRRTGTNAFHDADGSHGMSQVMRQFVAGQVKYLPDVLALICSTVNAYRRLVPGMWAPTTVSWGVENRTTALRVIPAGPKAQRVEHRLGPADANPYLALAAALATGLRGIEEGLDPGEPVVGNAVAGAGGVALPGTLEEAARNLRGSKVAREIFGDGFVDHYAATREWEVRENRKWVSDWDLARYFEII